MKMNIQQMFPNLEIILKIFLSTLRSNCYSERPFSVLKRIKARLICTLTQERLNDLSLLSIESDLSFGFKL